MVLHLFFWGKLKQKETELRKLMECLHMHNPCLLHGVHRSDTETPSRVSTQQYGFWKARITDFTSSDYWFQLQHWESAFQRDIINRRWCNWKAACSRVGYKLDPSFLPSHQHWPCCWGSGKSLYWINILWWIQPWLLLCLGEILEALFWRSVLRRREKSFWPPLTRWPTPVEKYSFHTVLIGSIGRI